MVKDGETLSTLTSFLARWVVFGSSLGMSIHMGVSSQDRDGAGVCGATLMLWVALNGGVCGRLSGR